MTKKIVIFKINYIYILKVVLLIFIRIYRERVLNLKMTIILVSFSVIIIIVRIL